jgi:hypothetical protein
MISTFSRVIRLPQSMARILPTAGVYLQLLHHPAGTDPAASELQSGSLPLGHYALIP